MAGMTRRGVLGGGVAAITAGTTGIATAQPVAITLDDRDLIDLCEQVIALEQQWGDEVLRCANWPPSDPRYGVSQAEQDRLAAEQEPLIDRIYELPTHTLAGFRARARAIMASDYGQMHEASDYSGQLYSLLHDLAELG